MKTSEVMDIKEQTVAKIKELFPEARDIKVVADDGYVSWWVGDKEYSLRGWACNAFTDKEDWGTFGLTFEEALERAAKEDWTDHGVFLEKVEND